MEDTTELPPEGGSREGGHKGSPGDGGTMDEAAMEAIAEEDRWPAARVRTAGRTKERIQEGWEIVSITFEDTRKQVELARGIIEATGYYDDLGDYIRSVLRRHGEREIQKLTKRISGKPGRVEELLGDWGRGRTPP